MFLGLLPLLTLPAYRQPTAPIADRVSDLVARMTPQEKARQLDMYAGAPLVQEKVDNTHAKPGTHASEPALEKALGNLGAGSIHDLYPQPALANEIQKWVIAHNRLGIPALFIEEGVHGYCGLNKTIFPCSINLAATFDTDLAGETAAAIAQEARADGVDMLLGPVLDVARDPRWGRVEEDFGEDPYLSGALGAAYVKAMQGESLDSDHSVISEPKHFAGHGEPESGLNAGPVHAGEREVRSVLLKSFQPAVEESHAKGIMAAYHDIDGVPCAGNAWLLTDVLRKEWGFQGFVLSDLGAIRELYDRHRVAPTQQDAILLALSSGVDMQFYDFDHNTYQNAIVDGVKTGKIPMSTLDRAVSRVLRMKFALGLFDHPFVDPTLTDQVNRSQIHLRVALDSARESMCLLKNEGNLLPLSKDLASIAVIGPNAATARMGDYTVTPQVAPPSILDKLKQIYPGQIIYQDGKSIDSAVEAAKQAKVAILVLGEREGISGEGVDRSDLNLPENQEQLLEAVSATGKPVVLVLENGRPLSITWASEHVPAILEAWYPGERGSQAVVETLFGDNNPAGRVPISFPRSVGTLPDFYNYESSKSGHYVEGDFHSICPFGHGLSYTTFEYSGLKANVKSREDVEVSVNVQNTGSREGDEVVQLYLRLNWASVETPVKSLKGFKRIHLSPGKSENIRFRLTRKELEIWGAAKKWAVEPGDYTVTVGGSSAKGIRTRFHLN